VIYNIPPKSKVRRTLPLIFRTILVVAYKASTTVFLNACGPKVGLVNTANIGQFQVVMKALSGYLRSRRSGSKLLIPDLQNQDQRPKTTARPQETRSRQIHWIGKISHKSQQCPCGPNPSTSQHL